MRKNIMGEFIARARATMRNENSDPNELATITKSDVVAYDMAITALERRISNLEHNTNAP